MEKAKKRRVWRGILLRAIFTAALAALGLSWPRLLAGRQAWVEKIYSEGIYQPIRRVISRITSLVPFSIAELLLYGLILLAVVLVLVRIIQWIARKNDSFAHLVKSVLSLAFAASIILNLFYIAWGFNYFRVPLDERMGLDVTQRSTDALEAYVLATAMEASALRETLHEDENGVFSPEATTREIFNALPKAYTALSARFPVFYGDVTRAKSVSFSYGLSEQGISGVYIGLTAEPNVNVLQPPLLRYQAAAHEMAHQMGIASENEAEFTAYLACVSSSDPNVRYSGLIYALIVSGNALYKTDAQRYIDCANSYGDAIWRDLKDYDAYWDAFEGDVQQSADKRNDAYLKHNSQPSGIQSYGESVDLLLAFYEEYGISP